MTLRWRQVDERHAVSECGRYKVCCVTLNGVDVFEAWHKGKMLDAATSETSAAMRKVCAEHAASSAAPEVDFSAIRPTEDKR